MKKLLSVMLGSLLVSLMFVTPGSPVKAAEITPDSSKAAITSNDDCGCHDIIVLTGSERNKIVSNLISSDEFKTYKKQAMKDGYNWDGAGAIEVQRNTKLNLTLEAVHFSSKKGSIVLLFVEGHYVMTIPM